jgi:hypothetical protein
MIGKSLEYIPRLIILNRIPLLVTNETNCAGHKKTPRVLSLGVKR